MRIIFHTQVTGVGSGNAVALAREISEASFLVSRLSWMSGNTETMAGASEVELQGERYGRRKRKTSFSDR
jgi:hypothetical protein